MALTNYWWLLIWMFTGGAFLSVFFPKRRELVMGKEKERWNIFPAVLLVIPYIIWAGFRTDNFGDTSVYRINFLNAVDSLNQLPAYLSGVAKDKGFSVIQVLIKSVVGNSDIWYFLILATIQLLCIALVFRKYSCDYWFSIFVFVASTDYLSWMHNGIRQFTAVTLIYAATTLMLKKKYIPTILIIFLASTIHGSVILMLPIVFIIQGKALNRKTILFMIAAVVALFFVEQFTNIIDTLLSDTQYTNVVSDWQAQNDDGVNPLRVLVYSFPTIIAVLGNKWISQTNDPIINMATNASLISTAIYLVAMGTSGIFIGRLPIMVSLYGSAILLPWEIDHIFSKGFAKFIKIMAIVFYTLFFYYQIHITWKIS